MEKKGAIELSMTTIIVIVLGVALLIGGIAFVSSTFSQITTIQEETFNNAEDLLGKFESVDQFLTIMPGQTKVVQNKDTIAKVVIANFESNPIKITAHIAPVKDEDLTCLFSETKESKSDEHTIGSGNQMNLGIVIKDENGALRTTGCKVTVKGAPTGEQNIGTITIRVEAK